MGTPARPRIKHEWTELMPVLTIDNRQIEVADGTKVIQAAEQLGIYIPRFCYHPALGSVGACRVCAVKFLEGPVSGIDMSCMVDAEDGMKVSTTDPDAMEFRKYIIECMMLNHPHDCPVCDEGGHCLLQDLTVSGGHGIRQFKGPKRTYADQFLGPLVQHEMNRCIQCYRCVRYYREYTGYKDLGVMGLASRVYFGRFEQGRLESPFSGNLIDICPTGVYTDKPSRYTGRRWDFERSPGVCIHCALGCNTTVSTRYRAVVRQEARFNPDINGHFICDRGRYGFYYTNLPERPRQGRINEDTVPAKEAVLAAAKQLGDIEKTSGAASVAVIGSDRSSLETLAELRQTCRARGWQQPGFWSRCRKDTVTAAVSALFPDQVVSMGEIESADYIFMVGADPVNEAPMLSLALRQAQRNGAAIHVADPRPVDLPFPFEQTPSTSHEMMTLLSQITVHLDHSDVIEDPKIQNLADELSNSRNPVIICGTDVTDAKIAARAGELSRSLQNKNIAAKLFFVLPNANSYGVAALFENSQSIETILEKIEAGKIHALIFIESDLWEQYADRRRLEQAIQSLDFVVSMDCLDNPLSRMAHIHIPTQTMFEAGGIYVNQEGRPQVSQPAHAGGLPVSMTGRGSHPPRTFQKTIPGADILPAAKAIQGICADEASLAPDAVSGMKQAFPALTRLSEQTARDANACRIFIQRNDGAIPLDSENADPYAQSDTPSDTQLEILPVASVFGDEALSSLSPCLQDPEENKVWTSRHQAEKLGIGQGDQVVLELPHTPLTLTACLADRMAANTLVIPRRNTIFWQQFDPCSRFLINQNAIHTRKKE